MPVAQTSSITISHICSLQQNEFQSPNVLSTLMSIVGTVDRGLAHPAPLPPSCKKQRKYNPIIQIYAQI